MTDSLALAYARKLIACESITPATGAVFDALEEMLTPLGFAVDRFLSGEDDQNPAHGAPVENLFAIRKSSGRHFAFAGHPAMDGKAIPLFRKYGVISSMDVVLSI
jgi:succinyl-diaminopimelate desuccinylase